MTPVELARQTFVQLSKEQKPPTPENYKIIYEKLAGIKSSDHTQLLSQSLKKVLSALGKDTPKYSMFAENIFSIVNKNDPKLLEEQLQELLTFDKGSPDSVDWAKLLKYMLHQLEADHGALSFGEKKERLNHVILKAQHEPMLLGKNLQALITSWGEGRTIIIDSTDSRLVEKLADSSVDNSVNREQQNFNQLHSEEFTDSWKALLIKVVRLAVLPQFVNNPPVVNRVEDLLQQVKTVSSNEELDSLRTGLKSILLRAEMEVDTLHRMQASLTDMFRLLISSMREMSIEDNWLQGQVSIIQDIISKPLDIDVLYNAQSSLEVLVHQQAKIKPNILEAKATLKQMMNIFVSGIAEVANSTGSYEVKINDYQQQIAETEDMVELNTILQNLSQDIASMNQNAKDSFKTFDDTQKKVVEAEKQINELTMQLEEISEAAHRDYLTGALNRRGMDEAIQREFDRADRHNTPISLAMLDIDHFKKINDSMGHTTGDIALAHLAKVVKSVIRPTDVLARYGGEEFVILLPGSQQDDAVKVVTGIQRNLTKNFFMHDDHQVLITFSAGVAERMEGEKIESIIPRADAALYIAKQTGRNRVVGATVDSQ